MQSLQSHPTVGVSTPACPSARFRGVSLQAKGYGMKLDKWDGKGKSPHTIIKEANNYHIALYNERGKTCENCEKRFVFLAVRGEMQLCKLIGGPAFDDDIIDVNATCSKWKGRKALGGA